MLLDYSSNASIISGVVIAMDLKKIILISAAHGPNNCAFDLHVIA